MRKKILFIAGMMACCTWASAQEISRTWVADKGDGTYQNPVLYADYSDPDVCAAGDDFYMTASSFNCIPGLPILGKVYGLLLSAFIRENFIFIGAIRIMEFT